MLPLLWISAVHAANAEQPVRTNPVGMVVFGVVLVACVAVYIGLTLKNEKKSEEEKRGDKF